MKRFVVYWLPVWIWCAIIFIQSSFATPEVVPNWPYFDKILHIGAYALLGLLLCRAFNSMAGWRGRFARLIMVSTLLTLLYGLSDEWHQSFVVQRVADVSDAMADFIGGFLGSCCFMFLNKVAFLRI